MSFGKRMQACREELGISQLALARQIGVSQSTIGNYEAGISFPKEDILLRLFDCLGTDPNTLFQDSFQGGGHVLSQSERRLFEQYRGLSPKGREIVFPWLPENETLSCSEPTTGTVPETAVPSKE